MVKEAFIRNCCHVKDISLKAIKLYETDTLNIMFYKQDPEF